MRYGYPADVPFSDLVKLAADKAGVSLTWILDSDAPEWYCVRVDREGRLFSIRHVHRSLDGIGTLVEYLAGIRDAFAFMEGENDAHS